MCTRRWMHHVRWCRWSSISRGNVPRVVRRCISRPRRSATRVAVSSTHPCSVSDARGGEGYEYQVQLYDCTAVQDGGCDRTCALPVADALESAALCTAELRVSAFVQAVCTAVCMVSTDGGCRAMQSRLDPGWTLEPSTRLSRLACHPILVGGYALPAPHRYIYIIYSIIFYTT